MPGTHLTPAAHAYPAQPSRCPCQPAYSARTHPRPPGPGPALASKVVTRSVTLYRSRIYRITSCLFSTARRYRGRAMKVTTGRGASSGGGSCTRAVQGQAAGYLGQQLEKIEVNGQPWPCRPRRLAASRPANVAVPQNLATPSSAHRPHPCQCAHGAPPVQRPRLPGLRVQPAGLDHLALQLPIPLPPQPAGTAQAKGGSNRK